MTNHKRTALITGASRGLGLALARELAQRDWNLIINARGVDALSAAQAELQRYTQTTALAGDVGDPRHRETLIDEENFLVFHTDDCGKLAGQLQKLLENPILRIRISQSCLALVQNHFHLPNMVNDFERHLEEIVNIRS